jgi:hypothetical protein
MGKIQERAERELKDRVKRAHSRKIRNPTYLEEGNKKEREGLRQQAEIHASKKAAEQGFQKKRTEGKSLEDYE